MLPGITLLSVLYEPGRLQCCVLLYPRFAYCVPYMCPTTKQGVTANAVTPCFFLVGATRFELATTRPPV